jgi:prolyl-tRNA editing enzyme YbaK/EbsC (Cys-tRNA(Pro) deacylase)
LQGNYRSGHCHRASQENGTGARAIACPFGKVDTDRHVTLERLRLEFVLHSYEYDPDADHIGLQASEALGIALQRMLKTLMAEVDGNPVCVVVPSDREVSTKSSQPRLAAKPQR